MDLQQKWFIFYVLITEHYLSSNEGPFFYMKRLIHRKQFGAFTDSLSETSAQLSEKYYEAMEQLRSSFPEKKHSSDVTASKSSSSGTLNAYDEITKHFQVQVKQKNEIERLEKENRDLRSKILIIRQQMEEREVRDSWLLDSSTYIIEIFRTSESFNFTKYL